MVKNKKYSEIFRLFGIILFIYILSRINLCQFWAVLGEINPFYYLVGVMFLIPIFFIRVLRWKVLIESIGAKVLFGDISKMTAKGIFLGIITPGKLGEFWRAEYLTGIASTSRGKAFYTTFVDRLIDLLIISLVAFFGIIAIYLRFSVEAKWQLYILIFALFIFLALFLLKRIGFQRILKFFLRFFIPVFLKKKADDFLNEFDRGLKTLSLSLFFKLVGWGFLYYLTSVVSLYFIILALGIVVPFWYLFLIIAVVWLILIAPITFLGLGTREATFIYFFSILGIPPPFAVAFSLLALVYNVLIALPGLILSLREN